MVRSWHAFRTKQLVRFRFWEAGLNDVEVQIVKCPSKEGLRARIKEYCRAIPFNIIRIIWEKI